MAIKKSRWNKPPMVEKKAVPTPKYKKVVKKEIAVEPVKIVADEMTIEDVLTALEKKSQ